MLFEWGWGRKDYYSRENALIIKSASVSEVRLKRIFLLY